MTTRTALTGAAYATEITACAVLWLRVPWPAEILLLALVLTLVAATIRQGDLPDGGPDFLLLRLWDVAVLTAGGVPPARAWQMCFAARPAKPPP